MGNIPEERKKVWNKTDEILNISDELALKADLLAFEKKYEEAVEYYSQALKVNPQNPHLWAFKGITLKGGLNREEEARQCWDNAKRLDPELGAAISYTEKREEEEEGEQGPIFCKMTETTRQKILKLMQKREENGSR